MCLGAWGLDFTSEFFTEIPISDKVCSFFTDLIITTFFQKDSDHAAEQNILKCLGNIRKEVFTEFKWFQEDCVIRYPDEDDRLEAKRKRLLFLFIQDLMSGVGGNILSNKEKRDNLKSKKVEPILKLSSWIFVVLLNGGMLFYVYLFARTQSQSRQSAWFISFVMWLVFEILVSSTAVVFFTHLLIPLYVLSDIRNIKKKVLADILAFRKTTLQKRGANFDPLELHSSTEFNAAKYLYRSWRVAFLFPEMKESQIVLSFQTPWPQYCFKKVATTVHSSYERRYSFVYQAISRVTIFFLASLLNLPQFVQDCFIQITSNSVLGYLGFLFIRLYNINPFLVGVPLFCAGIVIHFVVNATMKNEQLRKGQDLHPIEEELSAEMTQSKMPGDLRDFSPVVGGSVGGLDDDCVDVNMRVDWEDEDPDEGDPSPMISSAAAREKLAEGRRMSQFMLSNLRKDITTKHASLGIHASVSLPTDGDEKLDEINWSDDEVNESEIFPPEASHLEPALLPSGPDRQKIIWDDDSSMNEDSLDISVEFGSSNDGKAMQAMPSVSQDSSDFSAELYSLDSEEENDSISPSHLSSFLPDSVDEIW